VRPLGTIAGAGLSFVGVCGNARQVVARLRKALKAVFGLEKDPFHDFSHDDQWRTRFRAEPE
jgi:hypothetical protein